MSRMNETEKARLKARALEISYLGTQYAMNGLTPPVELEAEFAQIQAALRKGCGGPGAPEPSAG